MQKISKLNKTEPCARHNSTQNSKRRGYLVVSVQCSNARSLAILKERTEEVSYSVEKDCVDDSKSILAEIKGEDIDITSDNDNDEDELDIL